MVMSAENLRKYVDPLITGPKAPATLKTIRIGSKSLAWWPYKYTTDPEAKDILNLFEEVVGSGRQMAFQAHFSHPRELEHPAAQEAIRNIRMTGATIRAQAPLIRHVNDSAETWRDMWNMQARLGVVPYYMSVVLDRLLVPLTNVSMSVGSLKAIQEQNITGLCRWIEHIRSSARRTVVWPALHARSAALACWLSQARLA